MSAKSKPKPAPARETTPEPEPAPEPMPDTAAGRTAYVMARAVDLGALAGRGQGAPLRAVSALACWLARSDDERQRQIVIASAITALLRGVLAETNPDYVPEPFVPEPEPELHPEGMQPCP